MRDNTIILPRLFARLDLSRAHVAVDTFSLLALEKDCRGVVAMKTRHLERRKRRIELIIEDCLSRICSSECWDIVSVWTDFRVLEIWILNFEDRWLDFLLWFSKFHLYQFGYKGGFNDLLLFFLLYNGVWIEKYGNKYRLKIVCSKKGYYSWITPPRIS